MSFAKLQKVNHHKPFELSFRTIIRRKLKGWRIASNIFLFLICNSCKRVLTAWVSNQIRIEKPIVLYCLAEENVEIWGQHFWSETCYRVCTLMTCQNSMTFLDFFHDLLKNPITLVKQLSSGNSAKTIIYSTEIKFDFWNRQLIFQLWILLPFIHRKHTDFPLLSLTHT